MLQGRVCKPVRNYVRSVQNNVRSYVQNKVGSYEGNYPRQYFS